MHYILRQKAQLHAFNYRKGRRAFFNDGFNLSRVGERYEDDFITVKASYTQIATPKKDIWIEW